MARRLFSGVCDSPRRSGRILQLSTRFERAPNRRWGIRGIQWVHSYPPCLILYTHAHKSISTVPTWWPSFQGEIKGRLGLNSMPQSMVPKSWSKTSTSKGTHLTIMHCQLPKCCVVNWSRAILGYIGGKVGFEFRGYFSLPTTFGDEVT